MDVNICLQTATHHTSIMKYLQSFDEQNARFFAPHSTDLTTIQSFYEDPLNRGWCAVDEVSGMLKGYSILRKGVIQNDQDRLKAFGFKLDNRIDASYAPSVASASKGTGLAEAMWKHILDDALQQGRRRIFLWGGVKVENERAVRFYHKLGFIPVGNFFHEGENLDMVYLARVD
jgi:ribosomal protein S18 acetylase RimI-like enzyme